MLEDVPSAISYETERLTCMIVRAGSSGTNDSEHFQRCLITKPFQASPTVAEYCAYRHHFRELTYRATARSLREVGLHLQREHIPAVQR